MTEITVNGEPVPETAGNTSVRWEDTPNRHAYCDAEIARLRGELERAGKIPGSDVVAVPAGEVVAFGFAMERARETIAMLGEDLIRQRMRAERAEAALRGAHSHQDGPAEPGETADTAGILGLNDGNLVRWSSATAPGGYVCAVPVPGNPDDICGMPVESEPCSEHRNPSWRPE